MKEQKNRDDYQKKELDRNREKVLLRRQRRQDLVKAVILVAFIFGMFQLVLGITIFRGNDMEPALKDGDLLLYYRLYSKYNARDVVIYKADGRILTGRIAAVPGDEVQITVEGLLVINGYTQVDIDSEELYAVPENDVVYPILLQEGEYFILSEVKDTVGDSRSFGVIEKKEIKGKIITILRRRSI